MNLKTAMLFMGIVLTACSNDATDTSQPDTTAAQDAETDDGIAADVRVDTTAARDTQNTGLVPVVRGPEPALYDCTRDTSQPLPGRLSPAPLTCISDPSCRGQRMIVAHRGAGGDFGAIAPENSLSSIRAAILMGVDGIELDVRLSQDEVLMLMHDSTIDKTTEGEGRVDDFTAAELGLIRLSTKDVYEGDYSCETIPTLEQAFELTRDRLVIHVDAKTSRTDLIALAIQNANLLDHVIISTPSIDGAVLARTTVPEVMVQIRPDTEAEVDDALAMFTERAPEIFEIPSTIADKVVDRIHAAGSKALANAWDADILASVTGALSAYSDLYDKGLDLLQVEYPPLALDALERGP